MTDSYHPALEAWLQGDLPFEALPTGIRQDEERLRQFLESTRSHAAAPPALKASVMREITSITPDWAAPPTARSSSPWNRLLAWLTTPRTVQFTPAMAMAGGAAIIALLLLLPDGVVPVPDRDDAMDSPPRSAALAASEQAVVTRFVFVAPGAGSVTLTGDWLDWNTDEVLLRELRDSGVWTVDVPVPPGVHEYSFVVDGTEWHPDPLASAQADDGFGRVNSVLLVSGAEV
jgi:hypothetical protein